VVLVSAGWDPQVLAIQERIANSLQSNMVSWKTNDHVGDLHGKFMGNMAKSYKCEV